MIDLDYYSTVEELVELGPEKLKEVMLVPCDYVIISNQFLHAVLRNVFVPLGKGMVKLHWIVKMENHVTICFWYCHCKNLLLLIGFNLIS